MRPLGFGLIHKGIALIGLAVFGFVVVPLVWFVPWVLTLNLGILAYFPYEPNGQERYLRIVGPALSAISFSKKNWLTKEEIPDSCKRALVASEDAKFFFHGGVDFESVQQNLERNEKLGKTARGGSTITQQLVKNAFLSRERNYLRKAREIVGALLVDFTLSKEDQLAWYFNIVEFGPNLYGLQEAAKFYFKQKAHSLSKQQCVKLVAILPSPNKWNASLVKGRQTAFFSKRVKTISARMSQVQMEPSVAAVVANSKERKSSLRKRTQVLPSFSEGASLAKSQLEDETLQEETVGDVPNDNLIEGTEANDPEGTEPEGAEPEGAEPEGAEPEGAEPAGTDPEVSDSETNEGGASDIKTNEGGANAVKTNDSANDGAEAPTGRLENREQGLESSHSPSTDLTQ